MNELNELIERLYKKSQEAERPTEPSAGDAPLPQSDEEGARIARLRRVVTEMGALLRQEDQPVMPDEAPGEAITLRIMNHWESMIHSVHGIKLHAQNLEQDIVKMQPWGNFDVMKVEELRAMGCHVRFWTMPVEALSGHETEEWFVGSQALIVAQDTETGYFVTVSTDEALLPQLPKEAKEVEICPCPVSTLIMLQTRDKDSLKKMETLMGDYALVHYGEVYAALREALPAGAAMPELEPEHHGLGRRIRQWLRMD